MGILQKAGKFLGIDKFGKGVATATRVIGGGVKKDLELQKEDDARMQKLTYAIKNETDPAKKAQLKKLAQSFLNNRGATTEQIDPGINLSNKEILGSAANVVLNVATPGAFKGSKAAIIGKNAALGAGYGAASGLEKNRSAGGVVGSTVGGAVIGGGIGLGGLALKSLKNFMSVSTPKWLMDKAVKPTLDEARKAIKYGQDSLGEELLKEGVKGGPRKLLEIADSKLTGLEDELQTIINAPVNAEKRITRESIAPYLKDLLEAKAGTPGLKGDVQRIKNVFESIPEQMTLAEANQMKRRIYNELRDVSYKLDAKLGTKAKPLKQIAKGLKEGIEAAVGGDVVKNINQKLSLYGRLENRITDQMARSMRNNSFGLTDAILTAGGVATMNPLGVLSALGAAGLKHAAGSTVGRTTAAQALKRLGGVGTGIAARTAKSLVKRVLLNAP